MTRLTSASLVWSLLVVSVGCAHPAPASPPGSPQASKDSFDALAQDALQSYHAFQPTLGTQAGLHAYDAQLEDFSPARVQARVQEVNSLLARIVSLRKTNLTFDQRVDLDALEGFSLAERLSLERVRSLSRNPTEYVDRAGGAIDALVKRNFAPPPARLQSVIARLQAIPGLLRQGKANLDNPPLEFVELGVQNARGAVGYLDGSLRAWAKEAAGADHAQLADFTRADDRAVAALSDFATWIDRDLRARAKGSFALGEPLFLEKLKFEEGIDLPLDALLARGRAQLAQDHAAFLATARKIDPVRSPAQVMQRLSDDHASASGLVAFVQGSVERCRQFLLDRDLITLPSEARPTLAETPAFQRAASFASMDSPGAFEPTAEAAFYYVTPVEKEWTAEHRDEHLRLFNRPVVDIITLHEVFPGHFTQFLYAKSFPSPLRKLVHAHSNEEGWAHYGEQMALDQGFANGDPKMRLAQLSEALLRDCRYVVGIQLHTRGMSVEEGTRVFVNQCFQQPAVARAETLRGTFDPTYLYYTYGKLEVQDLARDWLAQKRGTLKQFHDAFVQQGALPIPLVRRLLFR